MEDALTQTPLELAIHKRYTVGAFHGPAKLSDADVVEIVRRVKAGESQRQVARAKGVTQPTVHRILTGKHWRHVTSKLPHFAGSYRPVPGFATGTAHHDAKLSDADVVEIIKRLRAGQSRNSVARQFNVCANTVTKIDLGETWKHVARPEVRRAH